MIPQSLMKPRPEGFIQREILRTLKAMGIFCYRNNSIANRGRKMDVTGRPDIEGIMPDGTGRYLGIEVKRPGEAQSENQIAFQRNVQRRNGVYILARDVAEVVDGINRERR